MVSATLIAEGRAIAGRITSQEWVQGGSGSFPAPSGSGAGVDGMLAALTANNLGWVVGQLGPLTSWMDGLDSDAGAVTGLTQSWQSAATQMQSVGDGYERRLRDLDGMSGKTIDAYAAHGAEIAEHFRVQGELVGAVAVGVRLASQLVRNVHGTVQDGVAEVAATALAAKTRSVLTGGSMSPAMVAQVTAKSASVTARVGPVVAGVVATLGILGPLIRALMALLKKLFTKTPKKPAAKPGSAKPKPKPLSPEQIDKKIDELKKTSSEPKRTSKSGKRTSQQDRDGGLNQAKKDFDELTEGLEITTEANGTRRATLPDGRTVNVRDYSSQDGGPTLEIFDKSVVPNLHTKFRY